MMAWQEAGVRSLRCHPNGNHVGTRVWHGDGLASLGDISDAPIIDISRMDRSVLLRVDQMLQQQLERATEILRQHRSACERLVDGLVAAFELSGQEVLDALDEDDGFGVQRLRSS